MKFRMTFWSTLLAAGLFVATPALAQVDAQEEVDEEAELDEDLDPDVAGEEEADEDAASPEDDEAEPSEEPVDEEAEEPQRDDEPAEEDDPAPEREVEPRVIEEQPEEPDVDEPEELEAPDDTDLDVPERGMAIAPAYQQVDTNVRVIGNLDEGDRWTLELGGYIRAGYTYIEADPNFELFGRNDGFELHDARLTTRGEMDNGLGFVVTVDAGSRLVRTSPDSPVRELAVRLTDGYGYYAPFEFVEFNAGQFKAPFDVEDLISTSQLLFVHRSVANRGVQDVEGFNRPGLSQGRQIGVQARGEVPIVGGDEGLAASYALALANGNGANRSLNENSSLATYGRAAIHWDDMVAVGGAFFRNNRTLGDPPNQVGRLLTGWTADLQFNAFGATLLANVVSETREVPEIPQDPEASSLGYQIQIAYEEPIFGFQPAYRFAYYDRFAGEEEPDADDPATVLRDAALTYHTIGINYNAQSYPIRVMANYTVTIEDDETRQLDNDRIDLLLQLQW